MEKGFSLFELLVVLSIASVLAVMSFGVSAVIRDTRLSTTANELLTALNLARSEAAKRQLPVSLCKSVDGIQCNNDATWGDGWIVFVDNNHDGNVATDDIIVWRNARSRTWGQIVYRGFPGGMPRHVTFQPSGFTFDQNGTFYICGLRGSTRPREVVLYKTGRARSGGLSTAERAGNCG